jgi:hypothetical protein
MLNMIIGIQDDQMRGRYRLRFNPKGNGRIQYTQRVNGQIQENGYYYPGTIARPGD